MSQTIQEYEVGVLLQCIKNLYGEDKITTQIRVERNEDGKKQLIAGGEGSNCILPPPQIRPPIGANNHRLFMPCYKKDNNKLVCIDFDEKTEALYNSKIWKFMTSLNTINCESNKGYHYYINVVDSPVISNYQNISNELNKFKQIAIDWISDKSAMWEPNERKFNNNNIVTVNFKDIKDYLHPKIMGGKDKQDEGNVIDIIDPVEVPQANVSQIKDYLKRMKNRYSYQEHLNVGIILYNNFEGKSMGLQIWKEWSALDKNKHDQERDDDYHYDKYKSFQGNSDQKLSYKTLRMWADQDSPMNKYERAYKSGQSKTASELALVKYMNKELAWCIQTSEYLLTFDDKWVAKKKGDITNHYENLGFMIKEKEEDDKAKYFNPFEIWRQHEDRKTYQGICFDPTGASPEYYNIWDGYEMTPEKLKDVNIEEATEQIKPILDHIKYIWCKGNEEHMNYVLNWFAMKLQKPAQKIAVVIALQSKEGAGKNVILDMFEHILGSKYHATISNINQLVGDFNGFIEGKMFMILDELMFGGDHKTNNKLKNLITDPNQVVNKKGKEQYKIDNYCDYFITTNMSHFVGVESTSRRYMCLQLDNKWAGVDNTAKKLYFNKIRMVDNKHLAKFLYDRDISKFNPREFDRTELLQNQVEKGWKSDIKYIYKMLESQNLGKGIKYNKKNDNQDWYWLKKSGDRFYHRTDELFSLYCQADLGAYAQCVPLKDFEATLTDVFNEHLLTKQHKGRTLISLPDIEIARQCFNEQQQYTYSWGSGLEEIVFSDDSTDEDDY